MLFSCVFCWSKLDFSYDNKILLLVNFLKIGIQTWSNDYKRFVNTPYENEVTLTGQNPPLKCCQPPELFTKLNRGLNISMLKISKLPAVKLWEWFNPGLYALAHTLAGMAEAADFSWELQIWQLVTLKPFNLQIQYLQFWKI